MVRSAQRFTKERPCPVCGGYDKQQRRQGQRCYGFLSDEGKWAHCTREELAGGIAMKDGSQTYAHRLTGDCRCGQRHDNRPSTPQPSRNGPKRRIAATYDYTDENGALLFQTVRFDPKDFSQRRPDGNGGWIWNLKGVRRVLYRLPELLAADLAKPVFVCEGEKDVDNLIKLGLVATTNPMGAKKWSPAYSAYLKGRRVVMVPHNDKDGAEHVPKVANSVLGIAESVRVLELAGLPDHGDVSDWLNMGGTVDKLMDLASKVTEWEPSPPDEDREGRATLEGRYEMADGGIVWNKPGRDGDVPVYLTNFTAEITAQLIEDDGVETKRSLEIEAKMQDRTSRFSVGAAQFGGMGWAMEHLGTRAVVYPGNTLKDHARTAIQLLSKDAHERHVYTHTGWRKLGEDWAFLHAGGAIGANGSLPDVEVHLPGDLRNYVLPEPPGGAELVQAIRASLRTLELADDAITVPIFAGTYRAVLGAIDAAIHMSGATGEGKTALAALAQQHFGPGMDARHLPGSWSSTGNALEGLAFSAKDVLLVVDDFAPTGSATDVQRMHREADRLIRAQGNSSGRMRMRADATLKPAKPPRGLILSTGEDVPKGQSLRARLLVIETGKDALDWDKLTACQEDADNGLYAQSMAGYVRRLASRYEEVRNSLKGEVDALRAEAHQSGQHRRTADLVANLGVGFRHFLAFAQESDTITQAEADGLWQRCWRALGEASEAQGAHQRAAEPTTRFLELLSAAIASGRAHVADKYGEAPSDWKRWGWREWEIGVGSHMRTEWRPQGQQVGWIDGHNLYLEADAAYAEAQKLARDGGDSLTVMLPTLKRRLKERGLLASTTQAAGREWLDVRRTLQGQRRKVLHLDSNSLIPPEWSQGSQSGDGSYLADPEMAPKDGSKTDNPPELWSHEMEPNRGAAISEDGDDGSKGSNGSKTQHLPRAKAKRRLSL